MRKKIAKLLDLPEGKTKRFSFNRNGVRVDAFVANFKGDIVAYENLCRHLPITLDYGDGEFFSKNNNFFVLLQVYSKCLPPYPFIYAHNSQY